MEPAFEPTTTDRLNHAIEHVEPHLKPVLMAVRDLGVGLFFVKQGREAFRLPRDPKRAAMTIIGDDFERADGPDGFHMPSLRRIIRSSSAFAVVSCEPLVAVYASVAMAAGLTRRNTLLIETRPEQEIAWLKLIQKHAPGRPLQLATVKGGHA
jgi:hypothetical protein